MKLKTMFLLLLKNIIQSLDNGFTENNSLHGKRQTHSNPSNKTNQEDDIKTTERLLNGEVIYRYNVSNINKDNLKESIPKVRANKPVSEYDYACDNI